MIDLLLVNVPIDLGKKPYDLAFPFLKRLNFGILAIASYMKEREFQVEIFDPQAYSEENYSEEDCINKLLQEIEYCSPLVVGLSCISGFSYLSCKKIAYLIRQVFPSILILVGGKDHVGQIADTVLSECAAIDIVVRGEGEEVLCQLINSVKNKNSLEKVPNIVYRDVTGKINSTLFDLALNPQEITRLNYSLYPNFHSFPPSLEISRGCPFGCAFCVSAKTGVRKKDVSTIIEEAEYITQIYGDNEICLYLETPMFLMQDKEISQLACMKKEKGLNFTWRTETRVDYLSPVRLQKLAEAGLRVLDLGFESASPDILTRMGKTQNTKKYLEQASEILRSAYDLEIIVKMNILFYIGETVETIGETISFLEQNLPYTTSVSAYPLLLYPGSSLETGIEEHIKEYGGSLVKDSTWEERHLWPVNPSTVFTYDTLQELGTLFTKSFQTMEIFYKQKKYGYFSPSISYLEFVQRSEKFGIEKLPFSKGQEELNNNRQKLWSKLISLKAV
ncbi:radical SAM protein [Nostoc sp. 106C]|uniref:B12-binding domain-containing radical SAM protein n=1 Tax=Nostoc sp. 106C TaxID=1932667 RepID=UPI000A3BA44D|nr:radical SAM protein [Nostoc sp. 106C]OUL28512.1 hypothetical protein BV375_17570 [Nostoc sp. 106C]